MAIGLDVSSITLTVINNSYSSTIESHPPIIVVTGTASIWLYISGEYELRGGGGTAFTVKIDWAEIGSVQGEDFMKSDFRGIYLFLEISLQNLNPSSPNSIENEISAKHTLKPEGGSPCSEDL
eukprot:scaffold89790_cov82-Cyclotella_meneghiniana.AAC.3